MASEALFSLINGDDMYMTYEEMGKKSYATWIFSQVCVINSFYRVSKSLPNMIFIINEKFM